MPIDTAASSTFAHLAATLDLSRRTLSPSDVWSSAKGTERTFHDQVRGLRHASFVSFAKLQDCVSIWAADDRAMQFHVANAGMGEILRLSRELLDVAADPFGSEHRLKTMGTKLYQALFAPIQDFLDPARLLYVHFGAELRHLPVSLLRLPTGEFLLDAFRVTLAADFPCQRRHDSADRFSRDSRFLTIVGPECGGERFQWEGARRARQEGGADRQEDGTDRQEDGAEEIGFLPPRMPHHSILTPGEATRESFLRLAAQAQGIHCRVAVSEGVHGPQIDLSREPAEREAAESAGLDSLPLSSIPRKAFAHCTVGVFETSPVSRQGGDQHAVWRKLVGALHQLGVSQVLVPRWNVDPAVLKAFAQVFYRTLLAGAPVDDAFRDGIRNIRSRKEWSHPHHWAGFAHSASHL